MSIVDALARDHRQLEALLDELTALPSHEAPARLAAFNRLQGLLQAHARAEEEVVYRALRRKFPEDPEPLEAYEQHHVADLLLQELASAAPGDAAWAAKARVLEQVLSQHISGEEITLFALLGEHFDEATLAEMERSFVALRHEPLEKLLGPLRRAMPPVVGRALLPAQVAAGRLARRFELYAVRRRRGGKSTRGRAAMPGAD